MSSTSAPQNSINIVDTFLHRNLKSGNEYNKLIPAYTGTAYNFDKETDKSTTYDTLRFMAQWSNKYAYQMKEVAKLMKGRTIAETANNIYQFLYWHFQYKLDGSLQTLYSPSAAWYFRKQGFDCKTYSLLASCILQNLNITHSFRMVQQAGIMPGEWSHVYVIIPDNNIEYVIDATTHNNKQVSYTKKYDYNMEHLGLASPYVTGLGCACSGLRISTNKGLGAPANLSNTVANFHLFLNELERKGVSKATTDKMLELVRWNVENGIDPNMQEIVKKALLQPAGKLGEILPASSLIPAGTTYSTSPLSNVSIQGTNVSTLLSAATGLITGNPLALLSLIPMEKTFAQVFANGFDLSCWGASYSEQKAKAFLEKRSPEIVKESGLESAVNTYTLDKFLNLIDVEIFWARNGQQSKYASCTRKGYALQEKGFSTLMVNTLDSIKQNGYQLIPNGKKPTTIPGKSSSYDSYIVVAPVQQQQQVQPQAQAQQVTYQTVTNPDGTKSTVATPQPIADNTNAKSSSSATTPLLIGAGLLALKFLI